LERAVLLIYIVKPFGQNSCDREITNYPGSGFEIFGYTSSDQSQPEEALSGWKNSPPHNAVILERDGWANKNWPAFGVGIYKGYAAVWFGDVSQ
jgi:uncharacterized protein YkwD